MGKVKTKKIDEVLNKYDYRVAWSEDDEVHIAKAAEVPSILAHGNTAESAILALKEALHITLELMEEDGQTIPQPLSLAKFRGEFLIRTTPEKHRELTVLAKEADVSLNQFVLTKLG